MIDLATPIYPMSAARHAQLAAALLDDDPWVRRLRTALAVMCLLMLGAVLGAIAVTMGE